MKGEIEQLIYEEAEASELNQDAEPTADTKVSRPNRNKAKILSVRLTGDELKALQERAESAGVGPSTMARNLIVRGLDGPEGEDQLAQIAMGVERLREDVHGFFGSGKSAVMHTGVVVEKGSHRLLDGEVRSLREGVTYETEMVEIKERPAHR